MFNFANGKSGLDECKIMLKFLKKPYPFNEDLRYNAKLILFISLGVLAFLLLFQPIDIRDFSSREIFYLIAGLFVSTFLVLSFNLIILPSLFPKIFVSSSWNIKREIVWNIWMLLTISASDFLIYTLLFGVLHVGFFDVAKLILLGFLPVSVLITINQNRLLKAHLKSAQQLNNRLLETKMQKDAIINFESEYKKDELSVKPDALLAIKSSDNYIEIYYRSGSEIKKQLIRSTLKKADEIIRPFDFIMQCHRAFIINIHHIIEIKGSSQGYKIIIEGVDLSIPVSQKYINEFKKLMEKP